MEFYLSFYKGWLVSYWCNLCQFCNICCVFHYFGSISFLITLNGEMHFCFAIFVPNILESILKTNALLGFSCILPNFYVNSKIVGELTVLFLGKMNDSHVP